MNRPKLHPRKPTRRRRGIAMMMVMIVIGAAGVLALGMAASSSMRTQVARTASTQVQAKYLAESGLNLAVYYLKNPTASPVALGWGENGNVHYRGETGITFTGVPGSITTTVTNPANGEFAVTSVGACDGYTATATATLKVKKSKQLTYAAYMTGAVKPTNRTTISGGMITNGSLLSTAGSSIAGLISTATTGSSADVAGTDFDYPVSVLHYLPTYFYKGKAYTAKVVNSQNWNGGAMSDASATNPLNIWYFTNGVKIKGATTITGTIAVPVGEDVEIDANLTTNPKDAFPALIAPDDIVLTRDNLTVNLNGVAYLGNQVKVSGNVGLLTHFNVTGAMISPRTGFPFHTNYRGWINLTHDTAKSKMEAFADEIEAIDSVTVTSWETDTTRPQ